MRRFIAIGIILSVSGCATHQVVETRTPVLEKVGQIPKLDTLNTVPVGGSVFSQFRYWSRTGHRLLAPVDVRLSLGGRVVAAKNDFLLKSIADGQPAFCTETRAYVDGLVGPYKPACFLERGGPGVFTHVTAAPSMVWFETKLPDGGVPYESSELAVERPDAFRFELLYQGASNKTLRLAYREFKNDLARPAFFQDVSYDIDTFPMQVSFRSVRIEVLEAGNNGMKYRVLSGF